MRILYLVERFWPYIGGVEVASAQVLPGLVRRGHEVVVVTSNDDPRLPARDEHQRIPIHRLPLIKPLLARDVAALAEVRGQLEALQRQFRPHLLHVLFTGPSIYYVASRRPADAPMLLSFHGSWPAEVKGLLARTLRAARWVTACSQAALRDLQSLDPGIANRSSVILNGIDPPQLAPTPLPLDPPVVVCAGRLSREKGFDLALEAWARVASSHPHARLIVAGDGPERQALQRRTAELGLSGSVELPGWVSPRAIPALVNQACAVLVPSRHEGFGLFALEGALMERPVVATRVGGLPEVVVDGRTGVLVDGDDPALLAAAIVRLLNDPEGARKMGRQGRQHAITELSCERCLEAYDALYRRLGQEVDAAAV